MKKGTIYRIAWKGVSLWCNQNFRASYPSADELLLFCGIKKDEGHFLHDAHFLNLKNHERLTISFVKKENLELWFKEHLTMVGQQ